MEWAIDDIIIYVNVGDFHIIKDSERSDECIDFTMICVFFLCLCTLYSITSRNNNAPISNFEGGFRCKNEYPWCIIDIKSKHFPT
ncbi:Uncharacterized protein FWK35_00034448, partial [Aphis craccivora]